MIRIPGVALMLAGLAAASAGGQTTPPGAEDARFQFHKVEDGFVRLDQRTGQLSQCSRRSAGWTCQLAPDERAALEAEIARLQVDNAGLKKHILDKGLPLPGGGDARAPAQPDLDRMVAAVEKAWRRLIEMFSAMHKDMMKKT